jgi:CRP-like cAMP-binding protein
MSRNFCNGTFFRNNRLCQRLPEPVIAELCKTMQLVSLEKDDVLFYQGDSADQGNSYLYIVTNMFEAKLF